MMENNELIVRKEKYKTLPIQVLVHFKDATNEELDMLALVYSGKKPDPNFTEWLESFQQSTYFKESLTEQDRYSRLRNAHDVAEKELNIARRNNLDKDDLKPLLIEEKRLASLMNHSDRRWMELTKELTKLVQTNLHRETPKKVDMTVTKVKPSDVARLIREANDEIIVDAEYEEVKDD